MRYLVAVLLVGGLLGGWLYLAEFAAPEAHAQATAQSQCAPGRNCAASTFTASKASGDTLKVPSGTTLCLNSPTCNAASRLYYGGSSLVTGGGLSVAGATNSTVGSGSTAFSCTTAGCRLNLGSTSRYLTDNGTDWSFFGQGVNIFNGALKADTVRDANGADLTITSSGNIVTTANVKLGSGGTAIGTSKQCEGTIDFGSIAAQQCDDSTFTCTGATTSMTLSVDAPALSSGEEANLAGPFYRISAADTVSVRLCNITGTAIDPGSANFKVRFF